MISVIIPVYNVEKFIRQCLDSILSQTYKNYEVILIDDKSKDNSLDIIKEYEKKYSNFFVIENEKNSGPGASRNKGIDASKGEYIMFVDSDDYIEPNTLEDAINAAKKYNADIVRYDFSRSISNIEYADRRLYPKLKDKIIEVDINKGDYFLLETAGPCNKLFKKDLIKDSKFPMGIYFEDLPFIISNIIKAKKIVYLNEVLYRYRFNPKSIMGMNLFGSTKILDILTSCEKLDEFTKGLKFDKEKYESLKLMNCIYVFNDIMLWKNLKLKEKKELISYLYRVLELKYGDIYNNSAFIEVMKRDSFFRRRIKIMKKFIIKREFMNSNSISELIEKSNKLINKK